MQSLLKKFALALTLAVLGSTVAQAAIVRATGFAQGKSNSMFTWTAPLAKTYKLLVYVGGNGTATKARYRIYPKGMPANATATSICSSTNATYPCYQIIVNQSLNKNKWVVLRTAANPTWAFTKTGVVTVWSGNLLNTESLSVSELNFQNAVTLANARVKAVGYAQGASKSLFTWTVPAANTFKVLVYVPSNATATKARYRVYPKGKNPSSALCSTADATYPCYEILVNQSLNKNKWVQLKTSLGFSTKWAFSAAGYVTVWSGNLINTQMLGVHDLNYQIPLKVGQLYQGGIIFYLDRTQQHGFISATFDQSPAQVWDYNNPPVATGATLTELTGGQSNTTKIVTQLGRTKDYAAKTCDEWSPASGYKDWYLPTKDQLALMYQNLALKNKGNFNTAEYYWSSSEEATLGNSVWVQFFGSDPQYGRQVLFSKINSILRVRAVRSF